MKYLKFVEVYFLSLAFCFHNLMLSFCFHFVLFQLQVYTLESLDKMVDHLGELIIQEDVIPFLTALSCNEPSILLSVIGEFGFIREGRLSLRGDLK
jgi:hypothetical protein